MALTIKQGETFRAECVLTDMQGALVDPPPQIEAQLRDMDHNLICDLVATPDPLRKGAFTLTVLDTTLSWPIGCAFTDIWYRTEEGVILATETFSINVIPGVTECKFPSPLPATAEVPVADPGLPSPQTEHSLPL